MAKFTIEEHEKRTREILTPTQRPQVNMIEKLKQIALKRKK